MVQRIPCPLPIFINKVLLEHDHVHLFHLAYHCFFYMTTKLNNYDRALIAYKAKNTWTKIKRCLLTLTQY
jgi:hypothetical protein